MNDQLQQLNLHPDITIRKLTFGEENAPLLVIDNFLAEADLLVERCKSLQFAQTGKIFPGIRAPAPENYRRLLTQELRLLLIDTFELGECALKLSMCHYSLVTTPPEKLGMIQRIPHVDSFDMQGLASVHYLFRGNLGGTAFYRHIKTGYETINNSRSVTYFKSLESENDGPNMPGPEYINGDTPLFKQIAKQDGVYNRMLVYRRNSLHSGCIGKNFSLAQDPEYGRLSINSFIDPIFFK